MTPHRSFQPQPPDAAGVVSWVHIGDLHMTKAAEQNDIDLQAIVAKIYKVFAGSISFVFLPGDVADNGSRATYAVVRASLDRLAVPWCAIISDHDVHEKSFDNFLESQRFAREQDNQIGAWSEHGLLGTQLGTNKNRKKW